MLQEGVQIQNVGQKPDTEMYELNPDHTHFIMVEDDGKDGQIGNMRFSIEKELQVKYGSRRKLIRLMSIGKIIYFILIYTDLQIPFLFILTSR